MTDLVIGAAYGYSAEQIAPFLSSLRAAGYRGDIALIVTPGQVASLGGLDLFRGVDLVPTKTLRPALRAARQSAWSKLVWLPYEATAWALVRILRIGGRSTRGLRRQVIRLCFKPHLSRFLEYQEYLAGRDADRILMSDVRDVVFQSNPSDWMGDAGFAVSIEFDSYTIGTDPTNAAWITGLYGAAGLARLADRPVSCSGVSWGDRASVDAYLDLMAGEMLVTTFAGPRAGIDQGYHNWLLWTGQLGVIKEQAALASEIATLSLITLDELDIDAEGWLRNRDGSVPGIIHMYDRVPGLDTRLAACRQTGSRGSEQGAQQ